MIINWKCSEIIKEGKYYKYVIYNNTNEIEIKCSSIKIKKEVEQDITATLKRMNLVVLRSQNKKK